MRRFCIVFFCSLLLCACAVAQISGIIQCNPDEQQVPAQTALESPYQVEQLKCGQAVGIIDMEKGYFQIQIGNRIAYVDAKNVRLRQTLEQQIEAQETRQPISGSESEAQVRHEFGLSFEISNIYYDEPGLMRNKGFMWGVSGDYAFRPNDFMFKVDSRFSMGDVDYWSSGTGTAAGLKDYNFETRFSVGYDIKTHSRGACLTPFIGLGERYLFDGLSAAGPGGYDRKENYLYSPLGMETRFHLKSRWAIGLTGEYDLFWHGWQHSETADAGLSFVPQKYDQNDGWGARGSAKIVKNLGRVDFAVEPYFRYWNVDESDLGFVIDAIDIYDTRVFLGNPYLEPHNTTTEWGLRLGIAF